MQSMEDYVGCWSMDAIRPDAEAGPAAAAAAAAGAAAAAAAADSEIIVTARGYDIMMNACDPIAASSKFSTSIS